MRILCSKRALWTKIQLFHWNSASQNWFKKQMSKPMFNPTYLVRIALVGERRVLVYLGKLFRLWAPLLRGLKDYQSDNHKEISAPMKYMVLKDRVDSSSGNWKWCYQEDVMGFKFHTIVLYCINPSKVRKGREGETKYWAHVTSHDTWYINRSL